MADPIKELCLVSGYCFNDPEIGVQALTHSSYAKAHHIPFNDNERLEFLGDAVLEMCVSHYLFVKYPNMREGEMTRSRSWIVREDSLYRASLRIGLNKLVRLNDAEEKIGGRAKPSILSDAYEALIAAIYMDGGYEAAESFIMRTLLDNMNEKDLMPRKDAKSALQEYVQAKLKNGIIQYDLVDTTGPDHNKSFIMSVSINGKVYGNGKGNSKRAAEENAAGIALNELNVEWVQR